MSNIKNRTSKADHLISISKIESLLFEAGATTVNKQYDRENRVISGISFEINHLGQNLWFKLPAKIQACYKVISSQRKREPDAAAKERDMKQAERTAWKILLEWVQIQISMLEMQQAEFEELFLNYLYDPQSDQTFYEVAKERGLSKLLNPPKDERTV